MALARRQHGAVSVGRLRAAGVGARAVSARVERGWLRRLHRGVYAVGALESPLTAPAAALLALGPATALSHGTAAAFERDRCRDADLLVAGERVIRVTHRQVSAAPEELIARLAAALATGR